jgi:DNA-binding transcriptional MerR regulator
MWEKRYRLFKPQRAGNRYREFDDEDVHLLLYLRQQIEQGRAIGELAGEGRDALLRQMANTASSQVQEQEELSALVNELLEYVRRLDKRHLEARLAACGVFYPFTTC